MLKRKKTLAMMLAATMVASSLTAVSALEPKSIVNDGKLSGQDRYKTAVEVSKTGWSKSNHAIIINGLDGLVDALTATPYAALKDAPILLTNKDALDTNTANELKRLEVKTVDIVGGTGAVSDKVKSQLEDMNITVNRISGKDRYTTSLAVAKAIDGITDISKIAVVNGLTGLPDAVSVGAPAAEQNMPIILASPQNGIASSKSFLDSENISKSYVIGSNDSVSDTIKNSLYGTKVRLGGKNRHATNAMVMDEFYSQSALDNVYISKSGMNKKNELVDALAVGALAAKTDDPVMIVSSNLDSVQEAFLKEKKVSKVTQVGDGISSSVVQAIKNTQVTPEAKATSARSIDSKTVEITGSNLDLIDKTKVSMTNNTVSSYSVSTDKNKATLKLDKDFAEGSNSISINSNLGNKVNLSFTYTKPNVPITEVRSVEAITSEVAAKMSGVQYLEFTLNGGTKKTVDELKSMGYEIQFRTKNPGVLYGTSTKNTDGYYVSEYGKLNPSLDENTYSYDVVIKKDKKEVKSITKAFDAKVDTTEYKEIKHELKLGDNDNATDTNLDNNIVLNSNKMIIGETVAIANVKAIDKDNKEYINPTMTIKSSDESIVKVTGTNTIQAKRNGTATITIKVGKTEKIFSIEVRDEARKVNTVSLSKSSIKLLNGTNDTTVATIKDQYGDFIKGTTLVVEDAKIKDATIATKTEITISNEKGESTITITAHSANVGSNAKMNIKKEAADTTSLTSITVSVEKDDSQAAPYSRKLETQDNKDDKLDVYSANEDKEITLKLNNYNRNGYLLKQETINDGNIYTSTTEPTSDGMGNGDSKIWLKTTNKDAADVTLSGDDIKVVAKKDGSTTIEAYETKKSLTGIVTKTRIASKTIYVSDTTPKITSIYKYQNETITKAESIDVINRLLNNTTITDDTVTRTKVDGVTLSGTSGEVLLDIDATSKVIRLFIDNKDNKNGKYDSGETVLATIEIEPTLDVPKAGTDGKTIDLTEASIAAKIKTDGLQGEIIVYMYHGEKETTNENPFDITKIKIDIPKD